MRPGHAASHSPLAATALGREPRPPRGAARRRPRRSAARSGLRGSSSARKSTNPTSWSTSAAPLRAKGSSCASIESSDGTASTAHAAKRVLRRRPHPPALVGEKTSDRRRRVGADDVAGCARRVNSHEPLAVVESREQGGADRRPAPRPERLDGGGANVRVRIPRECDQRRLAELRIRPQERGAPEAHCGVPVAQERQRAAVRERARAARARPRFATAGRGPVAERRSGCRSPSRRRCRRACGSRRSRSSSRDRRARCGSGAAPAGGAPLEALERGHAPPAPPLRARSIASTRDGRVARPRARVSSVERTLADARRSYRKRPSDDRRATAAIQAANRTASTTRATRRTSASTPSSSSSLSRGTSLDRGIRRHRPQSPQLRTVRRLRLIRRSRRRAAAAKRSQC